MSSFCISIAAVMLLSCSQAAADQWALAASDGTTAEQDAVTQTHYDVFVSVGDNYFLGHWLPVDSPEGIDATLELLYEVFRPRRVYWRGLQAALMYYDYVSYPGQVYIDGLRPWKNRIHTEHFGELEPEMYAVQKAHQLGMEIWGSTSYLDFGGPAHLSPQSNYFGPNASEWKRRVENPHWAPVDRYGYRRLGGVIEFAHPDAREAVVDVLMHHTDRYGYDGLFLLNYNEMYTQRHEHEFGFNQVVVDEFKDLYGVDLLANGFHPQFADAFALGELRGRYTTQFFRELKERLAVNDRKLGLVLNPREPHFPQPWPHNTNVICAGKIWIDYPAYIREGIMDVLTVYGSCALPLQINTAKMMGMLTDGTDIEAGVFTSAPDLKEFEPFRNPDSAITVYCSQESTIVQRNLPPQSIEALDSGSTAKILRVLYQVAQEEMDVDVDRLIELAAHENLLIRRQALNALIRYGQLPKVRAAMEKALFDDQEGVRSIAIQALYRSDNQDASLEKILESLDTKDAWPSFMQVMWETRRNRPTQYEAAKHYALNGKSMLSRGISVWMLRYSRDDESRAIIRQAVEDDEFFVRYWACDALMAYPHHDDSIEALLEVIQGKDDLVQAKAAHALGICLRVNRNDAYKDIAMDAMKALFIRYAKDAGRPGGSWGFRPVGMSMLDINKQKAQAIFEALMDCDNESQWRVAEMAWKIRYIPLPNENFAHVSIEEDTLAFERMPECVKKHRISHR